MSVDADVAIVGYGPVGSAVAILLAQLGRTVTVLERWPSRTRFRAPCISAMRWAASCRCAATLIVVELVGAAPFAATNARIQRISTLARAAAPLPLGVAATALGCRSRGQVVWSRSRSPASAASRSDDPSATDEPGCSPLADAAR